jgi:hypothetical protein
VIFDLKLFTLLIVPRRRSTRSSLSTWHIWYIEVDDLDQMVAGAANAALVALFELAGFALQHCLSAAELALVAFWLGYLL